MKPVPDFADAKLVCYRQITKDTAKNDLAVIGKHCKVKPPKGQKPGKIAENLVKGTQGHTVGPWPGQKHTGLSIEAEAGETLYLIELDGTTQTRFGPSIHPIQLLPLESTDLILKNVGLIYLDQVGDAHFIEAAHIPANYGSIPATAVLTFTLDRTALETAWNLGVTQPGHSDYSLKVPFYLSLYDTSTGRPVWAYGAHDVAQNESGGLPKSSTQKSSGPSNPPTTLTHGGIHPGSASQVFY